MFGQTFGRIGRSFAAMGLALTLAISVAQPASAASWVYHKVNGVWFITMDADRDGKFEDIRADRDGDGKWDTRWWNSLGTEEILETLDINPDEDAFIDVRVADNNQRVGYEFIYLNFNDDAYWDRTEFMGGSSAFAASLGPTVVGPVTNPSGIYNLCVTIAKVYGRVAC